MSKNRAKIQAGLKEFFATGDKVFPCTVNSIDEGKCTIDVKTAEGLEIFDVKLRAVATEKIGFVIFPKEKTTVQICQIGDDFDYLMLSADEVEKVYIKIEDMTLLATKDEFVFNGGENKGMVKLPELIQKINAIENKVNQLIAWSATHTHAGVLSGYATSGVAVGVSGTLTNTKESDLENDKIKQ